MFKKYLYLARFSYEHNDRRRKNPIQIHIVAHIVMCHDLLIGNDLLDNTSIVIINGNVAILPLKEGNMADPEVSEVMQIDIVDEHNKLDLSHVTNSEHRREIQRVIANYKFPVHQRPRRLSP